MTAPTIQEAVPYGVERLYLNHPRSYIAVPIATAHDLDTASLIQKHTAGSGSQAKTGAEVLGLIDGNGNTTARGEQVVQTALGNYETLGAALGDLSNLEGSSGRFVDKRPQWADAVREIGLQYEPARFITEAIANNGPTTLPELVVLVGERASQPFARELFIDDSIDIPFPRLKATGALESPSAYRGTTVYQLHTCLFHCGVLRSRGSDTSNLQPKESVWELTDAAQSILQSGGRQ
ncbi:hypothetical protein RH831_10835 [Halodesulfurarchaeum sp. HSR-GB]|uniref:hypothetical protein n=1 Tax=Halodesulfurarchaeum sp. HSR-GB TaxID=3074077 RepID=UPI00285F845D|nr:hypothetical protein [Halodesulfurarchaeum sp. HSR-GB]MDR5657671.1 hypothetical protein [Halodesulfurarchaeum sp. HSR-GB]